MQFIIFVSIFNILNTQIYHQEDNKYIISSIEKFVIRNEKFKHDANSFSLEELQNIRNRNERYWTDSIVPLFPKIINIVCANEDTLILKSFINLIISTENSADEQTGESFAKIYICSPELVLEFIKYNSKRKYLAERLDWGFRNVTFNKEKEIPDYNLLKRNIELLMDK